MLDLLLACVASLPAQERTLERDESTQQVLASAGDDRTRIDVSNLVRVLDATTAKPLAGASVELWTEEGAQPVVATTRLAVLSTARDGSVAVPFVVGGVRADKTRIACAGYASRELHGPPDPGEFFLQPALERRYRVLDLDGRPIESATLSLRESCAHAVPASSATSDATGIAVLADQPFGVGELEVVATGFGTLSHRVLDHTRLERAAARFGEPVELCLARRAEFELELVDAAGKPLSGRRVVRMDGPLAPAWSDERGRVRLVPNAAERSGPIELSDPVGRAELDTFELPTRGSTRVTVLDGQPRSDGPSGRLQIRVTGLSPSELRPPVIVRGADGRARSLAVGESSITAPLGKTRVFAGAPFTGWRQSVRDLELTAAGASVELPLQREATLSVVLPDDAAFLHVQAGDDSITREELDGNPLRVHVPTGVRLVLWAETFEGEACRRELEPLDPGAERVASLADAFVRRAPLQDAPRCRLKCAVRGLGTRLAAGSVHASLVHTLGSAPIELDGPDGDGRFEFTLPRGDAYRLELTRAALDCVPFALVGRVPDQEQAELTIDLVARARVQAPRGERLEASGAEPRPTGHHDDELEYWVAPGPLFVKRKRGPVFEIVELALAPGELRMLE